MVVHNIGIVDANVRMFLALPFAVLAVTGAIAYGAYLFAVVAAGFALYFLVSSILRISLMYAALRISSIGGFHRVTRGREAAQAPRTA